MFVPYDDPGVVAFYCSNMPGDVPLVFLSEEIGSAINANAIACIVMEPRDRSEMADYVTHAMEIAKQVSEETGCETVVCLLPYAEFVEIVSTEISLSVPVGSFFAEHTYDSYEPGGIGMLYYLRKIDPATTCLHQLSIRELDLLSCAN